MGEGRWEGKGGKRSEKLDGTMVGCEDLRELFGM